MPPPRRLEKGSVLAGRYEILRQLGATRMSEVFEAFDRKLEEKIAVKVMRGASTDEEARSRFRQEVRLARKVHHRNVGGIHDFGEDDELEFITMELVPGQDLRHVLEAREPLDWDRAYALILEIGEGLAAVHEAGIIHRDLKPANIMVEPSGHPRVMDFGIAKADSGPRVGTTGEGMVKGTPEYMSPEQVRGRGIDLRSDLYAFGVVIFEVFTNRVPFRAETPVLTMLMHIEAPPPLDPAPIGLPSALVPVVRRAMAKDAVERFDSCAEMLAALREAWAQVDTDKISSVAQEGSGDRKTEVVEIKRWLRPRSTTALPEETRLLVPMLTRALTNAQTEVRLSAARALALQGPRAAVAAENLRALLRDPVAEVQAEAASALKAIEPVVASVQSKPPEPPSGFVGSDVAARPEVRAGPTQTIHGASSADRPPDDARGAATAKHLTPVPQPVAEPPVRSPTPRTPAPLPPPPAPPTPALTAPPPAPLAPAPAAPEPDALVSAPAALRQPSSKERASERSRPVPPGPLRTARALLPPWLLMLAVATGVWGIGRFLATSTPTPTTSTTLPPTTSTTLPASTTTLPVTTTLPPKKASGTNTTLATTNTTVVTTTTTTTTVPTTTTTTTVPATTTTTVPPPPPTPPPLKPPECQRCPPPDYPQLAQRLQREGTVELRIRVDEAGRVVEVRVLKAVEHLTDAAVRAARTRIYKPAARGGVPESAWVEVAIEFKLER